jgi:HD domain
MTMSNIAHTLVIPDSLLAKEATDILREHSTDLLFNHSLRVYLFAAEQGHHRKLRFDPELLYVAAAFHDFGLLKKFSSPEERFEVDGANAARQFLDAHNIAEDQVQIVWEAIALHTTPGIPNHMRPEVALLNSGVLLDVLGVGFDQFPVEVREAIVAKYPRINFKEGFIQQYFAGFAHKPATTFGTVNAGFCERFIPGFKSPNACDLIAASPFPDSSFQSSTS